MHNRFQPFTLHVLPRQSMTWKEFVANTPPNSIALDGVVRGGPKSDLRTRHFNYDHHDNVVREATMSSAMQVFYAIKGGLMEILKNKEDRVEGSIYVNDTDQDTVLGVWYLINYKKFEGVQSIPHLSRLLELTNRLDITGGAFPMNLDDQLVRKHNWIFRPYTNLRKSGMLAQATEEMMLENLEAVMSRLTKFMMDQSEEVPLDTKHEILYDSPNYKIIDEIGGNEARYYLFSKGLRAFISLVTRRPDGKFVYTVGRSSQYIPFPVEKLYDDFNLAENLTSRDGWNGSTIIGGSSRLNGSSLTWEQLRDITNRRLQQDGLLK